MEANESTGPDPDATPEVVRRGRRQRLITWFLGTGGQVPLTAAHCVHSVAESFFVVSMAGSIFFSVSPDAARPRVLLFLVVTLAPFLVMAPLVGPFVDRLRGGLATTMIVSFGLRAVLALLLAENLRSLLLFPLAFGMLVTAKTYTVARNALVPSLVEDSLDLVAVNSRLSRSATLAGALGAALAFALYHAASPVATLRVGAVVYLIGIWVASRVRAAARPLEPVGPDALLELVRPDVSGAVWDMMALRAAIGFALFQFGFSLRSGGEPVWVLGAVVLGNSVGAFVGTIIAPALRRRVSEHSMFTLALVVPAAATVIGGLAFNRVTLIAAILVLGAAVSVGRRALDATIQSQAPHARRGQVYASIETRLELAWVAAACLAVALRVASWIGVLALAGFLALATVVHLRRRSGLRIMRPQTAAPLPERLLVRAETLAEHGFFDEAIIVARAAADAGTVPEIADEHERPPREVALSAIERARYRLTSRPDLDC